MSGATLAYGKKCTKNQKMVTKFSRDISLKNSTSKTLKIKVKYA